MSPPLARAASLAVVAALLAAAGCGGDQPAYCQDRSAFQKSVTDLKDVQVSPSNVGDIKSTLADVRSSATTLVNSAKGEFGQQSQALKSAVESLGTAINTAVSSPSGQAFATVAAGVNDVDAKFKDLSSAVKSKC